MNKKLIVIDGNALLFRAYYGTLSISSQILKNSSNIPINAILTFARMILKILNDFNPTHILVAFDTGKKTMRHSLYEPYKGKRSTAPTELQVQFPISQEFLTSLKVKFYAKEGYEADDIISSLAFQYQSEFNQIFVVSSDRDLLQLVNSNTSMIIPQNGSKKPLIINYQNFEEIYNILPSQVPDFKGLVGDKSDNLPGVSGVGDKTAISLLKSYSSLENVYQNINELSLKMQEKLIKGQEMAFLSKKLAILDKDMSLPFTSNDLALNSNYHDSALDFFQKYELFSLVKQFQKH